MAQRSDSPRGKREIGGHWTAMVVGDLLKDHIEMERALGKRERRKEREEEAVG